MNDAHTCSAECPCQTGGQPVPDFVSANDFGFDAAMDTLATEDPEYRTRGLFESPSRFLLRTNFQTVERPHIPAPTVQPSPPAGRPDHDAPDSDSSSLSGAVADPT